jgi:hypothetical protein
MSTIILKKSSVSGKVPLVGDLAFGELALNYADGKLYYKTSGNLINYIANGGTFTTALSITSSTQATSTTTGALIVTGGVGIGGSVYVGSRVGWVNATNQSAVYQVYNTTTNSLDTIFA